MSKYDIVLTFFTIMYGLMLTDLFSSLHRLIRAGKQVKWHWLPLLTAWYVFIVIIKNWWDLYSFENTTASMSVFIFIAYGHLLILFYLLVSNVFPDSVEDDSIDLKSYYFNNHRYFWGLMTSVVVISILIRFFQEIDHLNQFHLLNFVPVVVFIGLLILLIISKKYLVHSVLVILFVIETFVELLSR
jgi:hypothetical protein